MKKGILQQIPQYYRAPRLLLENSNKLENLEEMDKFMNALTIQNWTKKL
jgi:hypothetical protein